ncbi:Plasmodium variant antigen protein Cir/Yir/Bir, putative [Plasmodium chabaudi adami]|uniref:Plasmodium variant antigen protein Cir/Yir/Bir, putative n=1 Tax=Plasmodium chabaudi adami TaxID=5826 RepID=A0A1D3LCW4_PLACE|nr:Plasmodium variant antigen protein Cir/Yir/Bir, putative [Plasmodium chabaudi adami]
MDNVCKIFKSVWDDFPDTLDNDNYQFKNEKICNTYCNNNCDIIYCKTDNDKIMAGWIYLIKKLYESNLINDYAPNNMNIDEYIIIWLIHMLKLKDDSTIKSLNGFYDQYKNQCGGHTLVSTTDKDYSDIIDNIIDNKNYSVDMDKNLISKFYEAFKILCSMYNDINSDPIDCIKYLSKAKEFVDKYQNLLNDSDIGTKDSSYRKILSSLSTDYDNFKSYCNEKCHGCEQIPDLTDIRTKTFAQSYEDASSSTSIASKLIPVLLAFTIPFFLGIAYKYSLFGIDKQLPRQYLREKLKKIKKKMNHYM